jgi:glycerol uptake facilitator protein
MHPIIAEFIGTGLLCLMGTGVVANVLLNGTNGQNSGWMVITTGWALGVYIGVVVAGPSSGAHINPAVTIGLAVEGSFAWSSVPGYILAQIAGAFTGAFLNYSIHRDHFLNTEDAGAILAVHSTIPAIRNLRRNFISEMVGTFVLILVIFYISGAEMKPPGDDETVPIGLGSIGALPVAFTVWAIGLSLGGTTGYAINPARDLGPRLFHAIAPIGHKGSSDWKYAVIPVLGPIAGSVMAAVVYMMVENQIQTQSLWYVLINIL